MGVQQPVEKMRKTQVPVPEYFKHHLVRRGNLTWLIISVIWFVIWYSHCSSRHRQSMIDLVPETLVSVMALLLWGVEKRSKWRYTLDENYFLGRHSIKLIGFVLGLWEWRTFVLTPGCIMGIRQERWRGLPMLKIELRAKYFWSRKSLLMVYEPDDQEIVETEILPILENYQQEAILRRT